MNDGYAPVHAGVHESAPLQGSVRTEHPPTMPLPRSQSTNPQNAALVAHIVQQTRANLDFLVSQNYLSAADTSDISRTLAGLAAASEGGATGNSVHNGIDDLAEKTQGMSFGAGSQASASRRNVPPVPSTRIQKAKALWDYGGTVSYNILLHRSGTK